MRPNFSSNDQLVDYLVEQGRIESDRVEDAFRKVDRREFVPSEHSGDAYADKPVPIDSVTISAPHMVAEVTELLELSGDEKVLEIGSGSGYQAAILGELSGKVVGIEIDEELAEKSRKKVPENVEIRMGNGFEEVEGNFEKILFSCATESFDEAREHIRGNGIIVGPVSEDGRQVLRKWRNGKVSSHGRVRYVKMQD
ncbi:MAG: protein-L-isoaspartate O-methyltransferase [Candidatus Nanohalobium sp.]